MLPKRLSVVLAVAAFWLCSATFAQDALVLHLPFDGSLGTPAESRDVALEPGKLGRAVHVKSGDNIRGRLIYDVSKLVDPRKGTLAFWCKTAKDVGPKTAFGRIIHLASEEEGFFYTWLRVSVKGKGDFTFDIYDAEASAERPRSHGFNYTKGFETWKANEWHHVTFAWHCLKGVRVYDNGQLVHSSWGKEHWDPLTPTVLCLGSTPTGPAMADLWFDELRLYTEPLEDAQAAALARGEDVRVPKKPEEFAGQIGGSAAKRLAAELGNQPGLMSVTLGKPTTIRQWLVKSAKIRKITCRQLHDGSTRTSAPLAEPAQLVFAQPARVTHLALDGPNVGVSLAGLESPEGRVARLALPSPLETGQVTTQPRAKAARATELRFYELRDGQPPAQGIRAAIAPTAGPRVDVLLDPVAADTGIAAVSLDLQLQPPLPKFARIELTEEAERNRALFAADFRVHGQGPLKLTLDLPDYVLWKGSRLLAMLTFDEATKLADGSSLTVHTIPIAQAKSDYVTQQLGWFAAWYSVAAEAHRWDSRGWDPASMPELRWLENVRRADPEHPLATAYHNRIFHKTKEVQVTIPGPEKTPMWARAQREAMRRTADVVHWWIDQRQTDDGQFGGGWNDDVEMLHGWDLLVLGAGDEKVKQAMARLCDGMWAAGLFTRGYSNRIWDVEHAAEDSTYSQPRMVPLEYGNPKWLERCMETASNLEFWTEINPKGHRHFKGYMFQAQKFREDPETDSDVPDNARAAKIGLYVVWYNGNERVKQLFREWADAWVEDSFKPVEGKPPGVLPGEIVSKTCQIGRDGSSWNTCKRYQLGALTYHMEDQLVGAYHFTGDRKYLGPIEAMLVNGRGAEASVVNWRRLTGDRKLDERFIQQAQEGRILPSFNAWLATGDKTHLANACAETVREFERNRFLVTEAEPPTDRVPLPGNVFLRQMILGGIGVWVCGWPQMAVSWEKTGYDFAALVLEATPKRLKVLAYNFGPTRTVAMRPWELQRGTYELKAGPDANQDDKMDSAALTKRLTVERATPIELSLPGDALTLIELAQLEAKPAGKLPDLAISREDVSLSPDRRTVTVTVHNIGSLASPKAEVVIQDEKGATLGSAPLKELAPPDDLQPKTERLAIALRSPVPDKLQVTLDPGRTLDEITRENNGVSGEFRR